MLKSIKIALLAVLLVAIMPIGQAQAGLCVTPICLFKMMLKMSPGFPVFDFSTVPVVIGQVPGTVLQKSQSLLKEQADQMTRNARSMKGNFSVNGVSKTLKNPSDFKIKKIQVPKLNPASRMNSIKTLATKDISGKNIDLKDPKKVAALAEGMLVSPGKNRQARDDHKRMRRQFYRDNIASSLAFSAHMQGQLEDMNQVIDDLAQTATTDGDENQSVRANLAARQTMNKLLNFVQTTKAERVKLKSAREIGVNIKPKEEAIYSNATGQETKSSLFSGKGVFGKWKTSDIEKLANSSAGKKIIGSASVALGFSKAPKKQDVKSSFSGLEEAAEATELAREAIDAHNGLFNIYSNKTTIDKYVRIIKRHDMILEAMRANDDCNIELLSHYYSNPSEVWLGDKQMKDVNDYPNRGGLTAWVSGIYDSEIVNNALPEPKTDGLERLSEEELDELKGKTGSSSMGEEFDKQSAEMEGFARISWDVGRQALMNVYANQEKWGKIKQAFSIWYDQKELYGQYWDDKYDKIKKHYKCYHNQDIASGPSIADGYKYNYRNYGQVVAAHKKFISQIETAHKTTDAPSYAWNAANPKPNYCLGLKADFSAPKMVDKPLPPYKEIIYMDARDVENSEGGVSIPYPEMPKPWAEVIKLLDGNGELYQRYPVDGEIDRMLNVKEHYVAGKIVDGKYVMGHYAYSDVDWDSNWIDEDKGELPIVSNRIANWLNLRKYEMDVGASREEAEVALEELDKQIKSDLSEFGYSVPEDFSIVNESDYEMAAQKYKKYRKEKVAEANEKIKVAQKAGKTVQARLEGAKQVVAAIGYDNDAHIQMSFEVAGNPEFKDLISEGIANRVAASMYAKEAAASNANEPPEVGCPAY
jgi:hypothetical protein